MNKLIYQNDDPRNVSVSGRRSGGSPVVRTSGMELLLSLLSGVVMNVVVVVLSMLLLGLVVVVLLVATGSAAAGLLYEGRWRRRGSDNGHGDAAVPPESDRLGVVDVLDHELAVAGVPRVELEQLDEVLEGAELLERDGDLSAVDEPDQQEHVRVLDVREEQGVLAVRRVKVHVFEDLYHRTRRFVCK